MAKPTASIFIPSRLARLHDQKEAMHRARAPREEIAIVTDRTDHTDHLYALLATGHRYGWVTL